MINEEGSFRSCRDPVSLPIALFPRSTIRMSDVERAVFSGLLKESKRRMAK